eukprot:Rhum_TRINITY_DN579_c0_g1::Rhum_TRINITY_DN579_c0_g1_i1::g.1844::m.1844
MISTLAKKVCPRPAAVPPEERTRHAVLWGIVMVIAGAVMWASRDKLVCKEVGMLAMCAFVKGAREVVNCVVPRVEGFEREGVWMRMAKKDEEAAGAGAGTGSRRRVRTVRRGGGQRTPARNTSVSVAANSSSPLPEHLRKRAVAEPEACPPPSM